VRSESLTKGYIYDMKFVFNFKLAEYTTLMSHMNELVAMPPMFDYLMSKPIIYQEIIYGTI